MFSNNATTIHSLILRLKLYDWLIKRHFRDLSNRLFDIIQIMEIRMQSQHANSLLRLKAKKEGERSVEVVDLVSPGKT